MTQLPPHIRNASHDDLEQIAALLGQLGYESTVPQVQQRFEAIQRSSTDLVLVAVSEEHVVGCISLHVLPLFHAEGFLGRITSLVVDTGCRGQGIGRALMQAGAEWFAHNGCVKVEVTSGQARSEAHGFYQSMEFAEDGKRFSKISDSR